MMIEERTFDAHSRCRPDGMPYKSSPSFWIGLCLGAQLRLGWYLYHRHSPSSANLLRSKYLIRLGRGRLFTSSRRYGLWLVPLAGGRMVVGELKRENKRVLYTRDTREGCSQYNHSSLTLGKTERIGGKGAR